MQRFKFHFRMPPSKQRALIADHTGYPDHVLSAMSPQQLRQVLEARLLMMQEALASDQVGLALLEHDGAEGMWRELRRRQEVARGQ